METIIVICVDSYDFRKWMFDNYGIGTRNGCLEVVIGDNRIIGVCRPEHLIGYRCNSVKHTVNALNLAYFSRMFEVANSQCLRVKIKPFKFGR